jgi:hypothetical protein
METREDILNELNEIAPKLASLHKTSTYHVPESYFDEFRHIMMERVLLGEVKHELKSVAPVLSSISKSNTKPAPANYFNSFSDNIVQKIRANEILTELEAIAPALARLQRVNTMQVPAAYFSQFPVSVLKNMVQPQQQAPVFEWKWLAALNEKLEVIVTTVFKPKYSVAFAAITTLVIVGVMMMVKIQQCDDLECKFAQLSNQEINSYLDYKSDAYSDEIFEASFEDKIQQGETDKLNNVHPYKDALKDIDDAALNQAIND